MNDLRFALRKLRQSPAATLTAIATLALGIGANTAVFSVVSSVLLAPLPFADSQQLVRVVVSRTQADGRTLQTSPAAVDFHSLRNQSRLLERVAAQRYQDVALNSDQTAAERITGIAVSDQWLETLRVKPLLGRDFDHGEQAEGDRSDTTLISYAFWQRYFGGNTQAIGKTLRLNDRNYTVIGVMPREFQYPYQADVWFPMTLSPTATAPSDLNIVGRLKSGVSDKQFADELHFIAAQVAKDFPAKAGMNLVARRFDAEFNRDPNRSILALVIAVAFVLAVACVNIANLQLARGQARIHEMAIRSAIGASKWSQMRLLLTESLVLAGFGGVFGLVLTFWGLDWLVMLIPSRVGEVVQHIRVDASVLIFAIGVCLLTTLLFGLAPALQFSQEKPAAALKNIGRCNTRAGGWITSLLIVTQVALAFVLLTGASFMSQNLLRLLGTDVGYEPANLLKVELTLPSPRFDEAARRVRAVNQILQNVQTIPGVVAAGATSLQPIPHTTTNELTAIVLERFADPTLLTTVNQRIVSASYFRTMGMRIIKGRGFADADTEISSPVLIVNETAARRFWPAGDPIGERLKPGRTEDTRVDWHTIVGVVNNIAEPDREDETLGTIYRVYPQATKSQSPTSWGTTSISLLIRGVGDSNTLLHEIRDTVGRIDSSLLLYEASSMKEALSKPLSSQRFGTGLFIGFGAFGLFLAALGTYGVIASSVSQRTPEFGIRIAIGARPIDLLRLVVSQGMRLVTLGLVIGTLAALLLSRAVAVVTTQINARNPLTFAAAAIALLLAGLLASWIPARRASRVDPIIALRSE